MQGGELAGQHHRSPAKADLQTQTLDFKVLSILQPADLPHSAQWECSECDELIRGELPLHLARERLGHQASPPPLDWIYLGGFGERSAEEEGNG